MTNKMTVTESKLGNLHDHFVEIKLEKLSLKNFKGIKSFTLDLDGENAKVFGDNATGKTTIYDSFLWLLFNKDSNNRADFSIKTLVDGKEINNLEHEVEAAFRIDGNVLVLRKVYKEKWTKKRGAPIAEFTGHETNHYIDSVPVKKKEYTAKVDSLVKEEVFKLLTSPTFFNEQMKWEDRRATLLEVCGDVEEADVLAFNKELKDLPTILKGRTIEAHKKVIAARRAEINKELNMIPVRIDEINNSLPEEDIDVPELEKEIVLIEKGLDEHAAQINNIKNGSAITAKQNELRQAEMNLEAIKRELESESVEEGFKVQAKLQEEQSNLAILTRKKDDAEHRVKMLGNEVAEHDRMLTNLRAEWIEENNKVYTHEHDSDGVCPTCNQDLPAEEIEVAKEKAVAAFNLAKSKKIEVIDSKGKLYIEGKTKKLEEVEVSEKEIILLDPQIKAKEKVITKLTAELDALRKDVVDARSSEKYVSKSNEIVEIEKKIKSLQENVQQAVADIEKEVAYLRAKRNELNAQIERQAQVTVSLKRIGELEEQQKELAAEFEGLEHELYLTEQFIQSKVKLLEEKINSKFKYARFNLFKTNINGGIEEICETTFKGIPFSSGLNNAARINVGIDIINTLTEHYGIRAPIFVDNSEAVTQLADTESQRISLIVPQSFDNFPSEILDALTSKHGSYEKAKEAWESKYSQLRIEKQNENMQEAI